MNDDIKKENQSTEINNENQLTIKSKINFNTEKKIFHIFLILVCLLLLKETFFKMQYGKCFFIKYILLSVIMPFLATFLLALYCKKEEFIKIVQKTNIYIIIALIFPIFLAVITLQLNIHGGSNNFSLITNSILSIHNVFILIFINLILFFSDKISHTFFFKLKSSNIKKIYFFYVFLILIGFFLPLITNNIFNNRFFIF